MHIVVKNPLAYNLLISLHDQLDPKLNCQTLFNSRLCYIENISFYKMW